MFLFLSLQNTSAFLISFTSSCVGVVMGVSASFFFGDLSWPASHSDAALMVAGGVTSFAGQIFMTYGLKVLLFCKKTLGVSLKFMAS